MKERATILAMIITSLVMVSNTKGEIIFVDTDAAGANNGTSWADAYNSLQDGLSRANSSVKPVEIRVAQGVYKPISYDPPPPLPPPPPPPPPTPPGGPTLWPNAPGGLPPVDRTATFQLINGVTLKGGYAGFGEPDPNARDIKLYETILSGDLAGNDADIIDSEDLFYDLLYDPTRSDNSYHVVIGSDINAETVFDGFTVTGGHADGSNPSNIDRDKYGGGMYNVRSCMTLVNCNFTANFSIYFGGGMYNSSHSRPTLTNCTFSGNIAHHGAGMCNKESSPMIVNCTLSGNSVSEYGGGMYNHINANPIITNCTVTENTASSGGGIHNASYSSPKITNCIFSNNSANYGGGVRGGSYSSPTISNCTFIGNSAIEWGGAVLNGSDCNPKISNCTFSGNSAGEKGHVMSNYHISKPILTNCILWGNTDNFSSQIALRGSSTLSVSYCNIQGGQMAIYIVEDSWINWGDGNIDTNPLLKTDGYHLQPGSPCIDVGDPAVDYRGQTDIDSQPRVIAGRVDIGADEYGMESPPLISVLPAQIEFRTFVGDPKLHLLRFSLFNLGSEPVNWSITEDCSWLNVSETSGSITGELVWITLNIDAGDLSQGRYICDIAVSDGNPTHCSAIVTVTLIVHLEGLLHVPKDFFTIQAAINAADDGDTVVVADGTYTGNSNRNIDFCGKVITVRSENGPVNCIIDCQHVGMGVYFHNNEGPNSVLAGFTITNAYDRGICCNRSSPTINNCVLSNNYGGYGGGLSNYESSPSITNCIFKWNSSRQGGGIDNYVSNPTITNCIFSANTATYIGGGIYNHESSPVLTNCIFSNNWTGLLGGGIENWYHSSPFLVNCIFSGNLAGGGGAICSERYSYPTLTNCILWGNAAMRGNNICLASYHWTGNTYTAGIFVNYSDVEGGESGVYVETGCTLNWGEGNIDADPCFVFPKYLPPPSPVPPVSPSYMSDIEEYIWTEYDYHLLPDSPCIDAGDPNYVAEHNETDLDGKPRIIGCQIDMGVYEYGQLVPSEVRIVPRTISLESRGKWITAFLWLPEGYAVTDIADIDSNSFLLDYEIEPERFWFNEEKQVVMARFSQEEVQTFLNVGEFELSISLQLMDGTVFEGRDLIRVTSKSGGKPDKYVQASNPNPADGATGVDINADLSWTASPSATSHDVYFGTSNPPPFVCNQTAITFDPGTMDYETRYYWRIDEVNKWGITTGHVWSFTTKEAPPPPGPGPKPPGAPGCFPADTPVWIDGAQVQISKVAAGQKVGRLDATDAESCSEKPLCLKEIESVLEYQGTYDYYNIVLETGNRINVVHSHYFLTASDQWVLVENLKVGSKLQSLKGPISIKTIAKREVPFTGKFYNLKIKGGDRYFVGKDGVAVRGH